LDKDKLYARIQKQLSDVPLILIGTGGTIPDGISGMELLAEELIVKLGEKYSGDKAWREFASRLLSGSDLESALTDMQLSAEIKADIIMTTWNLVTRDDIELMRKWITTDTKPELGKVIKRFYQADPECVNIITTNYDRVIEYACDQFILPINTLFHGEFYRRFMDRGISRRKIVNLLKVHGSLDWFYTDSGQVVSIPLQENVPKGFSPAIVTPGTEKFQRVLDFPFRDVLHVADDLIANASGYLCIGYGFNDSQIQTNIISGIRSGKTITVWTKELSDAAMELITKSGDNYIIVEADKDDDSRSKVIFPEGEQMLDEKIWSMEGLLKII